MIKLSDYIFNFLKEQGVKDLFMLTGGGCMHLVDSAGKSGINYICCLHEQAVGIAASAYSQYSNDLGVALVTTGPGGTNAITAVAGAWTDSVPLLVISGQVKRSDLSTEIGTRSRGFQEIGIVPVVAPITKYAVTVLDPAEIRMHLEKAVWLAKTGRPGPVWLDIPLDVQAALIEEDTLKAFIPEPPNAAEVLPLARKVGELIERSARPVILAGHGIRLAGAYEDFLALIRKLQIPVLTTWKAADFLTENDPIYFGRPGMTGQRSANLIIQNSDLIISIGARMDFGQIGFEHSTFARAAKKVIVDIDPSELNKFGFNVDLPVCTDAKQFIRSILDLNIRAGSTEEWKDKCRDWNEKYPTVSDEYYHVENGVSTYALTDLLARHMDHRCVFTPCSSGAGAEITMQCIKVGNGIRIINTPGLGSMGYCVPTALGAAVASGKRAICITGEGGFQMNVQDLETIRRHCLPVKFFVLNNGGYGSIMNTQRNHFNSNFVGSNQASGLTTPGLDGIAKAYGLHYYRFDRIDALEEKIDEILYEDAPVLCEIMVYSDEITQPRVSSKMDSNGNMRSMPLEDLWPFLSQEELEREMLIPVIE